MKDFSISMALVDYIPVILFFLATANLMRDLYGKMTKASFALFAAGSLDITIAGALKATYKLLYAAGLCDFEPLNAMFFPTQSIGFLLAGIGILMMLLKKGKGKAALALPPPLVHGHVLVRRTYGGRSRTYRRRALHSFCKAQEACADSAVRSFIYLFALYGIPLVAGFCRGGDELDRRGSKRCRSGCVARRCVAPAQKRTCRA